ncbi:MAG: hypothetical protein EBZ47_06405 [Chlamydiae bacterium]|nr:hypothetical protein [Chlamydiota bacterium]
MHYLIDGYNGLFRTPKSKLSLEEKRRWFIQHIDNLVKNRSCLVTIVFDSSDPSRDLYSRGHFGSLEIIFTPKRQTADECIETLVEQAKRPSHITVVTMDRQLREKCMLRGACVLNIEQFVDHFQKKQKTTRSNASSSKPLWQESSSQVNRLLAIFEKKLSDDA